MSASKSSKVESDPQRVRFSAGWVGRLERFAVGLEASVRRREGGAGAARAGSGEEWVGYRPYRPGDDPRRLDWDLMARLEQPFVRVTRRETSERWWIAIDTSASMGLGRPGKLQASAECASALTALGLRRGARVELVAYGGDRSQRIGLGRSRDIGRGLEFLEGLEAKGQGSLRSELSRGHWRPCGRAYVLSDLFEVDPALLGSLRGAGREVGCLRVLSSRELTPEVVDGGVRWRCPETHGELELPLDRKRVEAYDRLLAKELERWRESAARHGWRHAVASTGEAFESILGKWLGRGAA